MERESSRGQKGETDKKLTCEIRAAAEEIVASFGLEHLNPALQGVRARAGTQHSSLDVGVSDWHQNTALIYTIHPVQQLQS